MTDWRTLEPSPIVKAQTYPAKVTVGDTTYRQARVALTAAALYVFTEPDVAPVAALLEPGLDAVDLRGTFDPPSRPSVVHTDAGTVTWEPGDGCGCGSPLQHYRPFTPMRLG